MCPVFLSESSTSRAKKSIHGVQLELWIILHQLFVFNPCAPVLGSSKKATGKAARAALDPCLPSMPDLGTSSFGRVDVRGHPFTSTPYGEL